MNKKGFAFLIPEEEAMDDIYIHSSDLASAMNNDRVIIRMEKRGIGITELRVLSSVL